MNLRNHIKKVLREAVGVPEGIHDSSEILMSEIIANLGNIHKVRNNYYDLDLNFESPLIIADLRLDKIGVVIDLHPQDMEMDKPVLMSAGVPSQTKGKPDIKKKKPFVEISLNKDQIFINFAFAISEDMDIDDVKEWFLDKDNINNLIPTVTHELKHVYDNYKKKYEPVGSRVDYMVYNKFITGGVGGTCSPIRNKLFLMYFFSKIENLVRPSEIYSHMMVNKITKEEFLNELKSMDVYKYISYGMNYSTETLKDELLLDFDCVNEVLKANDIPHMDVSVDEQIETYMNVIPKIVANESARKFVSHIQSFEVMGKNSLEQLFTMLGVRREDDETMKYKQARMDEYMRKLIARSENPEKFYDFIQKFINFNSEKIFKKISKVYSLLPSEKENEIHSKINKRVMKETNYINKEFYDKKAQHEKNYKNETMKKIFNEYKKKNPPQK
jgi:hypothetical protein